jgi:hypothetical protein
MLSSIPKEYWLPGRLAARSNSNSNSSHSSHNNQHCHLERLRAYSEEHLQVHNYQGLLLQGPHL